MRGVADARVFSADKPSSVCGSLLQPPLSSLRSILWGSVWRQASTTRPNGVAERRDEYLHIWREEQTKADNANPGFPENGDEGPWGGDAWDSGTCRRKRESKATDTFLCEPRLRDKLFVHTSDKALITRQVSHAAFTAQSHVTPGAQVVVTSTQHDGTRLAAAGTTISNCVELCEVRSYGVGT